MSETTVTSFERVGAGQTLFQMVAQQIQDKVLMGDLSPGDMLPSERVLSQQFGVSRTVVREALKALELRGLLEIQQGRGAMVTAPKVSSVTNSMMRYLRVQKSSLWAFHELRSILETEIAALASQRRTRQDLETLADLLDKMAEKVDSPSEYAELDLAYHRALIASAKNPLAPLVLEPFMALMRETRQLGAAVPDAQRQSLVFHRRVFEAIRSEDPVAARTAMAEHCSLAADLLQRGLSRAHTSDNARKHRYDNARSNETTQRETMRPTHRSA